MDVLALARHRARTDADTAALAATYTRGGLGRLDALHLASAVAFGADAFCTTDDRLLRRSRRLDTSSTSVVSPLDLVLALP